MTSTQTIPTAPIATIEQVVDAVLKLRLGPDTGEPLQKVRFIRDAFYLLNGFPTVIQDVPVAPPAAPPSQDETASPPQA